MDIAVEVIETSSLGDRSYLASDGQVAVVVDPQRDIDRILALAADRGVRITHVVETHLHNDYVSGGLELSRVTGAAYVVGAGDEVGFERLAVRDGDELRTGGLSLRVLETPGHTHHHVSYTLQDATTGDVRAVFTGGSMLFGSTGRTDLLGPEHTDALTHAQYHSVRRIAAELPGSAEVLPTHGFGSFCSATPTSGHASTVEQQKTGNPALTLAEQEYVDTLLAGLEAYPAYYAHMGVINTRGPAPVDLSPPRPVDPGELRRRIRQGEWVVDLRDRTAFAAGHLAGSLAFELSTNFVTYLGWLYQYGTPLTLIGESEDQVAEARRELVRIGIDDLAGAATGELAVLADGRPLRSYPVADFAALAAARKERAIHVLDTRRNDEHAQSHVTGSQHVPLHELADRLDEIPEGELWVYCGSGYRASIAASLLDREGHQVVLINDDFDHAAESGLT
ncbi:glyoxylase-like metal-dependent hydrolase (beta-lactamase superfamily II) [Kribbella amoyensis]|uniref:Glyoxylase-like metal-dependent hydrolase (Beta-lactamase superfamily II) n=1 Tax=Kribbella amoyensis TaxID=996641 RepID=A0A561BZK4_9ACTN|nr:rhodanese-like domain-containing protein [Kribbella amoyensis]TWD84345.1 glyoxylase-like metal-dependent hydrolase (beta-lactamase superfamily II) [Kribbella amoyensis]